MLWFFEGLRKIYNGCNLIIFMKKQSELESALDTIIIAGLGTTFLMVMGLDYVYEHCKKGFSEVVLNKEYTLPKYLTNSCFYPGF